MKKQMLRILILSICFFIAEKTNAQNLVTNYSFETYTSCPILDNMLYQALPWFNPNTINYGTPDLFNTCVTTGAGFPTTIPSNSFGNQMPRTGNGYAGIICVLDTINAREYIEVALDSSLSAGQKYCVEFHVSLGEVSSFATSNIGAYFSVDSLLDSTQGNAINNVIPQIANSTSVILSDKINWIKIFGVFTAQGGEKFMTIGNFLSPQNTVIQNVGGSYPYAYYYIDDISVTACDTTVIGINETAIHRDSFKLYPNPNNGNMSLIYSMDAASKGEFIIYDITGKMIDTYTLQQGSNYQLFINETVLNNGVYFYKVIVDGMLKASDKLIIIK